MEYLWAVAGGLTGWFIVEVMSASTDTHFPMSLNFSMLYVGALAGYTFFV